MTHNKSPLYSMYIPLVEEATESKGDHFAKTEVIFYHKNYNPMEKSQM